jgi:type I restriction enzyme S subunit
MIEDLKPYAEYKESGLPWLGRVPAHWVVLRAKCLFREVDERSMTGNEELLSVSHLTGVTPRRLKTVNMFLAESNIGHKVCQPGDLVINTLWAWMGALGVARHSGIVSPAYGVYRLIAGADILHAYANNLLRTPLYAAEYQRCSTGVNSSRLRLYPEQFLRIPVLVPPHDEQVAIVRFLDWANGRMERAIRAKRKVIALLNEQKQAIIHRAVTRGLDPSVPLKASGIPWLGDIPEHWEVRRLSSLARFMSGRAHEQFVEAGGNYICVTARFVSTNGTSRKYCTRNLCPARRHDVLMVMSDLPNGRALARSYLIRDHERYAVNQRVCILRASSVEPRLLSYWANRNWHFLRNDDGLNQTHLSNYDFKTMPVLLPPESEQVLIADFLEGITSSIDKASNRLIRESSLLHEYRTRLVADVVTGKLDVREAAARLPVEAPLDTIEDDADSGDEAEAADEDTVA